MDYPIEGGAFLRVTMRLLDTESRYRGSIAIPRKSRRSALNPRSRAVTIAGDDDTEMPALVAPHAELAGLAEHLVQPTPNRSNRVKYRCPPDWIVRTHL
jgi:hypothetical protein